MHSTSLDHALPWLPDLNSVFKTYNVEHTFKFKLTRRLFHIQSDQNSVTNQIHAGITVVTVKFEF